MKSIFMKALVVGVAVATGSVVGCSTGSNSSNPGVGSDNEKAGTVGLQLTLPGGLQISSVSYAISGPNTYAGSANVQNAASISFVVPKVAPGTGYTISLSAVTTDGSVTCLGTSATFSVSARQTTAVAVNMACTKGGDAGAVVVNGTSVNCGTWTSAVANPSAPFPGQVVRLSSAGDGPNPSAVTYQWSASAGAIDTPSAANANFSCPASGGNVTITLFVGDGPFPAGFTCPTAGSTTAVTVACPPAPPPPPPPRCQTATGACTPTELAFIQLDISAGQGATFPCYNCLVTNACIDDNLGDVNHECGDNTGSFDGGSWSGDCMSTLSCIIGTHCAKNDVQDCVCGPTNAGNLCQTATNLNGACNTQEFNGLGVSDGPSVLKDLVDTTRPAGMANAIFACAKLGGCTACVP